jgi:hypothetical protein
MRQRPPPYNKYNNSDNEIIGVMQWIARFRCVGGRHRPVFWDGLGFPRRKLWYHPSGFLLPVPSAARSRSATARVNLTFAEPPWGDKILPTGEHLGLTAKIEKSPTRPSSPTLTLGGT